MWIFLGLLSAFCLGFYDVFKKVSLKGNNVPVVLLLNTMFGTLLLSPVLIESVAQGHFGPGDTLMQNLLVVLKAVIVLSSWILGYFAIKHLPLTIQGPINASRPVLVLLGALLIFGERLNALQWCGMLLGFASLFFISRIGAREGFSFKASIWLWMSIGATMLGAVSVLILYRFAPAHFGGKFKWRWSILGISVFLTVADLAYFYCLTIPGAMISIVSMTRRGSVIIPFLYGVTVLKETNVKAKAIDLSILFLSLVLLVLGSR